MKRWLLPLILTIALANLTASALPAAANATLQVTLRADGTAPVGDEAAVTVLLSGDANALLDYSVEGGTLSAALAPNETGPGEAQGMVFITRGTPGDATLIVSSQGSELDRVTVRFVDSRSLATEAPLPPAAGNSALPEEHAHDLGRVFGGAAIVVLGIAALGKAMRKY